MLKNAKMEIGEENIRWKWYRRRREIR